MAPQETGAPAAPPGDVRREALLHAALLVLVLLLGFLLRCRNIADVFLEGHVLPFDPDSSYHLWRIEEAARSGRPPRFDSFLNAPEGAAVIYPDGFDGLVGRIAAALGGSAPTRYAVQVVALLLNPLLGTLALLSLYLLGRRAFGGRAALWAAAFGAALPSHGFPGLLGRVDHHVCELLLAPLALGLLLGVPGAKTGRRAALGLGAGAALAALSYAAPTALLHAALLAAALCAAALQSAASAPTLLRGAALCFAAAAALVLPDAWTRQGLAYEAPSRLPLLLYALGAAAFAALGLAARGGRRRLLLALGALALGAAALAALVLRDALGYVRGGGVLLLVSEAQPAWADPWRAIQRHSLAMPIAPALFVALAWRRPTPATWAVAALGLGGFVLACLQSRFEILLAAPLAAALGAGAAAGWERRRALAALAAAAVLTPSALLYLHLRLLTPETLALLEASIWLANNTPGAGPRAGRAAPPYTVLSMWGDGSHLAYLAERPMVVGAFYHGPYEPGFRDAIRALYGDGDGRALLERRRVRYLVLPAQERWIEAAHRQMLGLGPPASPTLYSQLYEHDGASVLRPDGSPAPARGQLRLIYESRIHVLRNGQRVPALKIFERVPGALLHGACDAPIVRARVRALISLTRNVEFLTAVPCDGGRFALRLPYAGAAELLRGAASATVAIRAADVEEGRSVPVP